MEHKILKFIFLQAALRTKLRQIPPKEMKEVVEFLGLETRIDEIPGSAEHSLEAMYTCMVASFLMEPSCQHQYFDPNRLDPVDAGDLTEERLSHFHTLLFDNMLYIPDEEVRILIHIGNIDTILLCVRYPTYGSMRSTNECRIASPGILTFQWTFMRNWSRLTGRKRRNRRRAQKMQS